MSLVGKIFIVMILIMSCVFMGLTMMVYAAHTNWKDRAAALEQQVNSTRQEVAQLDAQREKTLNLLALERAARAEALAALEVRSRELDQQLVRAERDRQQLQAENAEKIKLLETTQNEMKRLKDEVDRLRTEIRTARQDRDTQLTEVRRLADDLNQREGDLRRLKERNQSLLGDLTNAKLILDRNGMTVDTPVDNIPPEVDGIVTAVRDSNLIEVSMGADEGIRKGHTLDVYRGNGSYLGRVVVIETSSDRSVGRIVPEFQQGAIRKGDRVASRLL